jgi:hypothetical protein
MFIYQLHYHNKDRPFDSDQGNIARFKNVVGENGFIYIGSGI